MSYLLMIVEPVQQRRTRTRAEGEAVYDRMRHFGEGLHAQGVLLAAESLGGHEKATRVAVRTGQTQLFDGPFAEAKEMIGGFFLLDVATREEALAIARRCPAAEWCTVEVRETGYCYDESDRTP
jgi:hypothetical protein